MKKLTITLITLFGFWSLSANAAYISIGGASDPACGSCFGGVYTLESSLLSTTATTETHRITYTLDLSAYSGTEDYIGRLAYHVTSSPSFVSSSLVSAPTAGTWDQTRGNVSQCSDASNAGWVCLDWVSGTQLLTTGTIFSWISDLTVLTDGLIDIWSIQADFDPSPGRLLSESAAVPIPGAALLFLTGLGLFGVGMRRR